MAEVKTVTIEIDVKTGSITKGREEFDKLNSTVNKGSKDMSNSMSGLNKSIIGIGASMVSAFAIKAVIGNAITTIVDFEKSISSLSAITGATGKDLEKLKGIVLSTAKETKKGATEVAKAFELVASAKPELLQNAEALGAVTKAAITLSKASGLDLVSAVNATTTGLAQFNLGAEKSTYVIDAMAAGAKFGASAIPETSSALEKFGAVADSANISLVDSVALVETLADKQLKGAEAGTQLKNVILKLKNEGLGFVDGQFNMNAALEEARAKFDAIKDPVERSKEQTKLFGLESSVAGEILLNNIPKFKGFQESISEVGSAAAQAAIQTDNVATKTEELGAEYDNLILSLNEGSGGVSKFLSGLIDMTSDALSGIMALNKTTKEFINETVNKATDDVKNAAAANAEETKAQFEKIGLSGDKLKESLLRASEQAKEFSKQAKERGDNNLAATYNQEAIKLKELANAKTEETKTEEDAAAAAAETTKETDKQAESKKRLAAAAKAEAEAIKEAADAAKEHADIINEIIKAENEHEDNKLSQIDREKNAVYDKYFSLIEAAKQHGVDTAELEIAQNEEINAIDAEDKQVKLDADIVDQEKRLEFEQEIANRTNEINEQIKDQKIALATALLALAGGTMAGQIAALTFEKGVAIAKVIIGVQQANALITAQAAVLAANPLTAALAPNALAQLGLNNTMGALSVATILATAIPQAIQITQPKKYRDGVIDLSGKGTGTSDSIPAMLSKGESVMTAKETQEHKPVLKAIREGNFDDYLNRVIVQQLYTHKSKERLRIKEVKQAQINFPKGFKVTNAKDISRPLLDAMEESKFLNQNASWR